MPLKTVASVTSNHWSYVVVKLTFAHLKQLSSPNYIHADHVIWHLTNVLFDFYENCSEIKKNSLTIKFLPQMSALTDLCEWMWLCWVKEVPQLSKCHKLIGPWQMARLSQCLSKSISQLGATKVSCNSFPVAVYYTNKGTKHYKWRGVIVLSRYSAPYWQHPTITQPRSVPWYIWQVH